ncbi:GMP synthase - Glutamine amidotransferase [Actinoalloteichus cyanogriseus DSM 43889]|uniref:GMP synthase - Glutamine amidotransferase n=2 Tax=Actinoalloteichus cyanogriseus TaxID=2893586 RepID=A0ABT1JHG3_ACTCY|nr:GMP synthase - Glutamine amidotransferase [Actinoalloteichus caeruleus DSM 43889]
MEGVGGSGVLGAVGHSIVVVTSVRVLVLQPDPSDPPARLGEWLRSAGAELDIIHPDQQEVPELGEYHALVCLGGRVQAEDVIAHPWLLDVRARLTTAVGKGLPTFAVCLGAQLLAAAAGGRVEASPTGPAAGPTLVAKRDAAVEDELFEDLVLMPLVVQAHRDIVTRLPPGATLLAASPNCPHQAFRVGTAAWGTQFHIETTPEMIRDWFDADPELAAAAPARAHSTAALAEAHEEIEATWKPIVTRFVRIAARRAGLEPREPGPRRLPLV